MATAVELFCSDGDAGESEEFRLSEPTDGPQKSPQSSNPGRGIKSRKFRGGKTKRMGNNGCGKNAGKTVTVATSDVEEQQCSESSASTSNDKQCEDKSFSSQDFKKQISQTRRSTRAKKPSKHFVVEILETPQKRVFTVMRAARKPGQPDVNQDGTPFCCDKCGSNYIVKPGRSVTSKGNTATPKKKRVFGIRYKIDPQTKKRLTLCNACGIRFDRSEKSQERYKVPKATEQDKLKYLEDAKRFASSLVVGLKDPDADRLACLHISSKPCGCMQRYIIAEGNMEESRDRASKLLKMIKDAKKLKDKKSYNVEELINKGKKFRKVGLGNGQKRSKEFEDFVLTSRQYLRNSLKFCERACQRILSYSNNFLHKKLKTEPNRRERIERTKGKMALGLLKEIADIPNTKCCEAECSMMARSHSVLLQTWRDRANTGQAEARKVLAEMLTPSGKVSNCANFITLVTGCSLTTIQSVAAQMRDTGGDREPPTHGLKKYWKDNPRRQPSLSELDEAITGGSKDSRPAAQKAATDATTTEGSDLENVAATEIETPALTAAQLRDQQQQLKRLQQQLEEQQQRISQRQAMIEQQLQQHKLKRQQQKQRQHQQELQQQKQQQQQQQQQLTETQQREMIQTQQASPEEVGSQPAPRPQTDPQQQSTQQQHMNQLAAQQQLLLQQLGAQQIAQQLAAQQQQVASTGTTVAVPPPPAALEGMMDSRLLQQNMQQLLQEIQNQINVQQNSMHQLLLEMQSEMTAQQLQQLGIPTPNSSGVSSGTPVQTVTTTTVSQPPPSYNAAVTLLSALNNGQMLNSNSVLNTSTQLLPQQQPQQQGAAARQGMAQPAQVIIQAIPTIQQNFLLGGTALHGQLLQGSGDSRQTPQQQILVSLPPSLTTECMTSTSLSQDSLNPDIEIVELQQIPLGTSDSSQSQGNGIQQVNLTNELDTAALARLSRVLSSQEIRPGMGSTLPQLHGRTSRAATSTASDLTAQSVLQGDSTDGQASSSSSLANEASQLNMNIESLLPEFQIEGTVGQGLVFKRSIPSKPKD